MIDLWKAVPATRLLGAVAAALTAAALVAAPNDEAPSAESVLTAFARGEAVSLSALPPAAPSTSGRRPPPALAREAAELLQALARLAPSTAGEPSLRAALEQLAVVDRAARDHFAAVRAELAAANASATIYARLERAEATG